MLRARRAGSSRGALRPRHNALELLDRPGRRRGLPGHFERRRRSTAATGCLDTFRGPPNVRSRGDGSTTAQADGTTWKKNIQLIDALASLDLASCDGDRRAADEQLARSVLDPNVRAFALTNLVVRPRVETSASRVASNKKDDATGPTR